MEEYYNMYTINEDGKRIEREVPSNLASLYEKSGWKYIVTENKKEEKVEEKSSFTSKFVSKKNDNSKNNRD